MACQFANTYTATINSPIVQPLGSPRRTTLWYSDSVILGILSTHPIVHGWDQHITFSLNSRKQIKFIVQRIFKSKRFVFEWAA